MAPDLKSAKLGLRVSKGALTKATGDFEKAVESLKKDKDVATVTMGKKIRLAAGVANIFGPWQSKLTANLREN